MLYFQSRLTIVAAALCASGTFTARTAHAQSCNHPRVLIVLDKSSSMVTGNAGDGQLKWDAAVNAVVSLVQTYGDAVDFGLMLFPNPSQCAPGQVDVDVGPGTATQIAAALATPPPESGNYTPMAETLDEVADYVPLADLGQRNYVLLVTDGWQWCDPYDVATRFDAVTSVETLAQLNIDTFVLGFGAGVDALNNNRMAVAGNTAIAGCDPTGQNAAASNLCYYQTESQSDLEVAFDQIVGTIVDEVCDQQDNDCDGFVDNQTIGHPAPLARAASGVCGGCVSFCIDGAWSACPTDGACDDGNACTINDLCTASGCGGTPIVCDDGNGCTSDSCNPVTGCQHHPVADGTSCSDGDPCTSADTCVAAACVAGPDVCGGSGGGPSGSTTEEPGVGVNRGCGCGTAAPSGEKGLMLAASILVGFAARRRRRNC